MYTANAIDIVIPSFRLDEQILLGIFNVDHPVDLKLNFYLVADNPNLTVPPSIVSLAQSGQLNLVINDVNIGFSETRNKGIRLGNSKWLLLLDDDIVPEKGLITAYAEAIKKHPQAIGFAGVTNFPPPFNTVTTAMEMNGMTGHFKLANKEEELMWVPTANVMLNRDKMDNALFNESLKKGGEDIEFLVRNVTIFKEKYLAVPNARVEHPWWDGGNLQTGRIFRYGAGAAQIAGLPSIINYTYHDFTNTAETLLLLFLSFPILTFVYSWQLPAELILVILGAEFLTNFIKSYYFSKKFSVILPVYLLWLKNCYELGYLIENLSAGRIRGFGERIDMGFSKKNPSWFRLNKWKILKLVLILVGLIFIKYS